MTYSNEDLAALGGTSGGGNRGGGFNWGGLVGQFQGLVGTAGQAYQDFSGAKPPKSQVNTAARATAAKDYTPWLIGGGAILLVLVLVGVLRK